MDSVLQVGFGLRPEQSLGPLPSLKHNPSKHHYLHFGSGLSERRISLGWWLWRAHLLNVLQFIYLELKQALVDVMILTWHWGRKLNRSWGLKCTWNPSLQTDQKGQDYLSSKHPILRFIKSLRLETLLKKTSIESGNILEIRNCFSK